MPCSMTRNRGCYPSCRFFRGGADIEAILAVTSTDGLREDHRKHVTTALTGLALKSMVEVLPDRPRHRLLEPIRSYAVRKVSSEAMRGRLHDRHAHFFTTLAERAPSEMRGPDAATWLARLDAELPNMRSALAWCLAERHLEMGLRLAGSLVPYWHRRGLLSEGAVRLSELIQAVDDAPPPELPPAAWSMALHGHGTLQLFLGAYHSARRSLDRALTLRRELGDALTVGQTLNNLGMLSFEEGDYGRAREFYQESISVRRQAGLHQSAVVCLLNLAILETEQGQYERSRAYVQQSLDIAEKTQDLATESNCHARLAENLQATGRYAEAELAFRTARSIQSVLGDVAGEAQSLRGLALLLIDTQRTAEAQSLLDEAAELARRAGNRREQAMCRLDRLRASTVDDSIDHFTRARLLAAELRRLGHTGGLGDALEYQAKVLSSFLDRHVEARALLRETLDIRFQMHDWLGTVGGLERYAEVAARMEDYKLALRLAAVADGERERAGTPLAPSRRGSQDRAILAAKASLGTEASRVWSQAQSCSIAEARSWLRASDP